jgi:hypothetical protein
MEREGRQGVLLPGWLGVWSVRDVRDLLLPGRLGIWSVRDAKGSVTAAAAWCMERVGRQGVC